MDARESCRALKAKLSAARKLFDAGECARALEEVDAALAIDAQFLAAQSLRERILAGPVSTPAASALVHKADAPAVSTEGYALFEQRAKRRRVEHCIAAARAAIDRRKIREAAEALDEVRELEPNLPELAALTGALAHLQRPGPRRHRSSWLVAAAAFGAVVLTAPWLEDSRALQSRSAPAGAPLVRTRTPASPGPAARIETMETADNPEPRTVSTDAPPAQIANAPAPPAPAPLANPPVQLQPVTPEPAQANSPAALSTRLSAPAFRPGAETAVPLNPANLATPTPVANIANGPKPLSAANDDEFQVKQALQRYRIAYEGLDAQSAQDIWPTVNQAALARAFEGLESQRLTFDACDVQMAGDHASATCRGTARYVPKVGSSDPRVEARVWSFALRKIGAEWKIDNARADR